MTRPVAVTRGPDWLQAPRGWYVLCRDNWCGFTLWCPSHPEAIRWADAHARQYHFGWGLGRDQ